MPPEQSLDERWAERLRPFAELRTAVTARCPNPNCNRRVDTLVAVVSGTTSYIHGERLPDDRLFEGGSRTAGPMAHGQLSRPGISKVKVGRVRQATTMRCKCGRTCSWNSRAIRSDFVRCAQSGADLVLSP